MLSINTNTSSLIAQNSLKTSTSKLNQAIERMSSGAKINHAKDNAANYSIATNYSTKLSALQVAEDNVNMGLDMTSTASESLSIMANFGTKLRQLVIQASNGTYSSSSLEAMTAEATQLINEIYREKSNCNYNGISLLGNEVNFQNEAMDLRVNSQGFLQEVNQRDTSSLTTLASVDGNTAISSGTYSISTAEELAKLATMTNNGLVTSGEFVLANNIDLSAYNTGAGWVPIGKTDDGFVAKFDGNGYTVSNLYINTYGTGYGLFGKISNGGDVSNTRLVNTYLRASWTSGCLCSTVASGAIVTNCTVDGATMCVTSNGSYYGGIAGISAGTVTFCYANIDMNDSAQMVGGILGQGNAQNCYSKGTIKGAKEVGGIVGRGQASNSFSDANVIGKEAIGGIVGKIYYGSVLNCCFEGIINGQNKVGGLAGCLFYANKMENCYFGGVINCENSPGIFTGEEGLTLKNCYYDSSKTSGLSFCGTDSVQKDGNVIDTFAYANWNFQIGTSSASSSNLSYTMHMENLELWNVLTNGLDSLDSISVIDNFLNIIENEQTKIGAIENRLMSVLTEISTQYENLVSSRSTIMDADMAEVSSEYIRQQILQQASATLMATANQSPSIALQLI